MAQLKDIVEIEHNRKGNASFSTIYLFPEGTFYRAYEWSAWLCCRYVNQFKATRRELKGEKGETVVFIGFPITSLGKFMPEDAQITVNENKSVSIVLPIGAFQDEGDEESLMHNFNDWKESVPLATPRRGSVKEDLKYGVDMQPHRMSEVIFRILAFPVEQKTPIECMNFIAELKQQIASLL